MAIENRRWVLRSGVSVFALAALAGCFVESSSSSEDDDEAEAAANALTQVPCPDVSGTIVDRSLAVTDKTLLTKFTFARVMNQIRTTANVATTETSLGIYKRWMKTFGSSAQPGDCNDPNIDPNDYGLVCPRTEEARLATINPFPATSGNQFVPIALFNRFDLAPKNGANCGEYRIVFAMNQGAGATVFGTALVIFEAALPNPTPAKGIESCLPVARFWQGLSADNNAASRAAKLERFYFTGTAVPGFAPVVKAAHYGLSTGTAAANAGQVRTNFLFSQWELREFKLKRQCTNTADPLTCTLAFAHVPVKANPADDLFAGTHPKSASFRTPFTNQVPGLAAKDVNRIRMSTANGFNEFESISQPGAGAINVNYASKASTNPALRSDIQAKLASIGNTTLSVNNILDRATTQTCAGCHQVSNGAQLGGGLTWPLSQGFTHVNQSGALSQALTQVFLPNRKKVLEKFINDRCVQNLEAGAGGAAGQVAPESGAGEEEEEEGTLGGSEEGAPN